MLSQFGFKNGKLILQLKALIQNTLATASIHLLKTKKLSSIFQNIKVWIATLQEVIDIESTR